jgi:hypothetical protein
MKIPSARLGVGFGAVLAAILCLSMAQGAVSKGPEAKTAVATNTNNPPQEIPLSVFAVPSTPKEGRNPFFPMSVVNPPAEKPKGAPVDYSFVLNGITPSGPRRTAMINGRTFEPGEMGEVRLPSGGRVNIKCEEIRVDSAIILVDGQRRELRLRAGV